MSRDPNININEQGIKNFLQKQSFSALLAFYAFYLSYIKRKAFTMETLEQNIDFLVKNYSNACFVFLVALSLIDKTINKNTKEVTYNITYYDELLAKHIKDYTYNRANKIDEERKNLTDFDVVSWKKRINLLEEYFK